MTRSIGTSAIWDNVCPYAKRWILASPKRTCSFALICCLHKSIRWAMLHSEHRSTLLDVDLTSPLQLAAIHSLMDLNRGSAMMTAEEMVVVVDCGCQVSELTAGISTSRGSIEALVFEVYR